jgi:hypothetical protein
MLVTSGENAAAPRTTTPARQMVTVKFPINIEELRPDEVKIVDGHSGRGLQLTCSCGCINWQHIESREAQWSCRNCEQVFTHFFPRLVAKVLELQPREPEVVAPPEK